MIKKEYGKDYPLEEREQFLRNTCDGMEEISYSRVFTPEELAKQREVLTEASIALADIEKAKKDAMDCFKEQAKPYIDETKMVGFYNAEGNLVSSRPAFPNELQKTVFSEIRKTGTDN